MRKGLTIWGLMILMGLTVCAGIPPYLPEAAPQTAYVSTTIGLEDVIIPLTDGVKVKPAELVTIRSLNGDWKFSGVENSAQPFKDDVDMDKGFAGKGFDDKGWGSIPVPLNWYVKYKQAQDKTRPYVKGWYRRSISLGEAELRDRRVVLRFGVIGYEARLFVNGKEAGRHHGDFTPWEIDITDRVTAGSNTLAIRVFSDFGPAHGGIKSATHVYGAQWSIGSIKAGIWQDVEMRLEPPVSLKRILVSPNLASDAIRVDYLAVNRTGREVACELEGVVSSAMKTAPNRVNAASRPGMIKLSPGENSGHVEIKLDKPERWSLKHPYLYYLTLVLRQGSQVVAAAPVRFGFREFKAVGNKFYLNGERVYLFGENFPSSRYEGDGLPPEQAVAVIADQLTGYKAVGCNIIRNAHAPTSPTLYKIADEIGLMVYDEWGWCFSKVIDEPVFERNNLAEVAEWVYRDYNHPSVVMWSCGNEVVHKDSEAVKRQLDKQVELVRALDRSGRPVGSFSGSGSWSSYGKAKLNTDFIDLHHYLGLSAPAWTCWNDEFNRYFNETAGTYAVNGKFDLPYIVWECVGFSWGGKPDANFKLNDINRYAEYVNRKTSWGDPNGIGFAGSIGLAAALDPARGLDYGKEVFGQRVLETIRQDVRIQGYAPWFHGSKLKMATVWNQPVLCGLRDEAFVPLRNVFGGKDYRQTLFVVNSTNDTLAAPVAVISLMRPDGAETVLKTMSLPPVKPWDILNMPVDLTMPRLPVPERCQLRVDLKDGKHGVSRNFYPLFIQTAEVLTAPVKTEKGVAVLQNGSRNGLEKLESILKELRMAYKRVAPGGSLDGVGLLIIPPSIDDAPQLPLEREPLLAMVRQGGIVLQLEQCSGSTAIVEGAEFSSEANTYVDLAITEHPVFAGLDQANFDTWNNPDHGFVIKTAISPFTVNALAVKGPFLGRRNVSNAVMEGALGKGRIFCSQLEATRLWGVDSAATTYLKNVLAYLAGNQPPYKGITPLTLSGNKEYAAVAANLVTIDLKPYANRGFADEVAEDGKGGWTDQGTNDFRMMPLGRQTAAGIPFEIIDPAKNHGKSCLVLRGSARPDFPAAITGIKVDAKFARLFFLHTCAWGKGMEAGTYRIRYADGSHVDHVLEEGRNIGDWWVCSSLSDARIGIVRTNSAGHDVSLFVNAWENPFSGKEIAAVDFLSPGSGGQIDYLPGNSAVPVLVAVTGEKAHPAPLPVNGKWSATSTVKEGEKPLIKDSAPGSLSAAMPAMKNGNIPALMTRFPADKFAAGNYSYITFRIKAETVPACIDLVLPEKSWAATRRASVMLDGRFRQWTRVRLNIKSDMVPQGKDFPDTALRGELFIYNGSGRKNEAARPAVDFQLDSLTFE